MPSSEREIFLKTRLGVLLKPIIEHLPDDCTPAALVLFQEHIRSDAAATITYFAQRRTVCLRPGYTQAKAGHG